LHNRFAVNAMQHSAPREAVRVFGLVIGTRLFCAEKYSSLLQNEESLLPDENALD